MEQSPTPKHERNKNEVLTNYTDELTRAIEAARKIPSHDRPEGYDINPWESSINAFALSDPLEVATGLKLNQITEMFPRSKGMSVKSDEGWEADIAWYGDPVNPTEYASEAEFIAGAMVNENGESFAIVLGKHGIGSRVDKSNG